MSVIYSHNRAINDIHDVADITDASDVITEPVTLEEMKNFLRLEGFSTDGTNITSEAPLTKTLLENETTVQDALLIDATILTLAREGIIYTKSLVVGNRKFTHNIQTGVVTFENAGAAGGEGIDITYGYTGASLGDDAYDFDNDLIEELITSAREGLEKWCGISIVRHTWQVLFTNQVGNIELPFSNNATIVSLKNCEDVEIVAANYVIRGTSFKYMASPYYQNMTIVYDAGYEVGNVPKRLKQAIMRDVAFHYENRNDEPGKIAEQAMVLASGFKRVSTWLS